MRYAKYTAQPAHAVARANVPMIYVSALRTLHDVAAGLAAFDLLTLLSPGSDDSALQRLAPNRRLQLAFHDIADARPDLVAPDRTTIDAIIAFGRGWTRERPLLIHCWAGISRSSAAAYIIACDANPGREDVIADDLRRRAPFVTPNRLMIALADQSLNRRGRMVDAIARIGRGADAFEGTPYQLPMTYLS